MALHLLGGEDDPGAMAPVADINVTPFIDVMLVLLVIFILTAPLMMSQMGVALPRAKLGATAKQPDPVTVSLTAAGDYFLDSQSVSRPELIQRLRQLATREPDDTVYVQADRSLDYGRIVSLLALVGQAGFHKVSLVSQLPQ